MSGNPTIDPESTTLFFDDAMKQWFWLSARLVFEGKGDVRIMIFLTRTFNITTSTYGWTSQCLIADTNNESPSPYAALTEQLFFFADREVSIIYRPCSNNK